MHYLTYKGRTRVSARKYGENVDTGQKTGQAFQPKTETFRIIPKANRYPGDTEDAILGGAGFIIVIELMFIIQLLTGCGPS